MLKVLDLSREAAVEIDSCNTWMAGSTETNLENLFSYLIDTGLNRKFKP